MSRLSPRETYRPSGRWDLSRLALLERIESLCGREFTEQPSEPPPAPPLSVG